MCFWDSDFPFRRLDKKSTANLQTPGRRKKVCGELKNGKANIEVVFYAILAHPSHMQFLLKSLNTKVTNTQPKIY